MILITAKGHANALKKLGERLQSVFGANRVVVSFPECMSNGVVARGVTASFSVDATFIDKKLFQEQSFRALDITVRVNDTAKMQKPPFKGVFCERISSMSSFSSSNKYAVSVGAPHNSVSVVAESTVLEEDSDTLSDFEDLEMYEERVSRGWRV